MYNGSVTSAGSPDGSSIPVTAARKPPAATEASLLGVDTGLPMLLVHRTAWDDDGRIVEWTRSVFRGDRFRFVARHRLDDDVPLPAGA